MGRVWFCAMWALVVFFCLPAFAFEVDSFYRRRQPLSDSTEVLNSEINARISKAVSFTQTCDLETLYTNVRNQISADSSGAGIIGGMENWADKNKKIEKAGPPPRDQSIYFGTSFESITSMGFWLNLYHSAFSGLKKGLNKAKFALQRLFGRSADPIVQCHVPTDLQEAAKMMLKGPQGGPPPGGIGAHPEMNAEQKTKMDEMHGQIEKLQQSGVLDCLMAASGRSQPDGAGNLQAAINVNGVRIGLDKLGHFFDQGAEYFREAFDVDGMKASLKPGGVEKALKEGLKSEEGIFGFRATGIKSYGDLAANYGGMLFWHRLGASDKPLVKCVNGQFQVVRPFDLREFVTDAWDEGLNCSEYKDPKMQDRVNTNLAELKTSCPAEPQKCQALVGMYESRVYEQIIGPACKVGTIGPVSVNAQPNQTTGVRR